MKKQMSNKSAPVVYMQPHRQPLTKETLQGLFGLSDLSDEAAEELRPVIHRLIKILGKHIRQKKQKKE
jgi:hypothetical protein